MPRSVQDKNLSHLNGRWFLAQGSGYGLRVWSPGAGPATAVGLDLPEVRQLTRSADRQDQATADRRDGY
jgi:hypothetical protein